MSAVTGQPFDESDFIYSPEQQATAEQRIELLECQVADLREQLISLKEQHSGVAWSATWASVL